MNCFTVKYSDNAFYDISRNYYHEESKYIEHIINRYNGKYEILKTEIKNIKNKKKPNNIDNKYNNHHTQRFNVDENIKKYKNKNPIHNNKKYNYKSKTSKYENYTTIQKTKFVNTFQSYNHIPITSKNNCNSKNEKKKDDKVKIRSILNKLSNENKNKLTNQLRELLFKNNPENNPENVNEKSISIFHLFVDMFFDIALQNSIHQSLYVELYFSLFINDNDNKEVNKKQILKYIEELHKVSINELLNMKKVESQDYDNFCKMNKMNDVRKQRYSLSIDILLNLYYTYINKQQTCSKDVDINSNINIIVQIILNILDDLFDLFREKIKNIENNDKIKEIIKIFEIVIGTFKLNKIKISSIYQQINEIVSTLKKYAEHKDQYHGLTNQTYYHIKELCFIK